MHLNQLMEPALEALEKDKKNCQQIRRLEKVGERKQKISVLKNKLAAWGIDVTYWRYTQFTIGDILFVLHDDKGRYNLVAIQKCKHCKARKHSFHINGLLDIGRVLTDGNIWEYHQCGPKPRAAVPQGPTREQRAFDLVAELVDLVGNTVKLRRGG